jgi:hypothetical protein
MGIIDLWKVILILFPQIATSLVLFRSFFSCCAHTKNNCDYSCSWARISRSGYHFREHGIRLSPSKLRPIYQHSTAAASKVTKTLFTHNSTGNAIFTTQLIVSSATRRRCFKTAISSPGN